MDWQSAFNIAAAIAGALGGWWLKTLHESMKDLRDADHELATKVHGIEVLVAGDYVTRDSLDRSLSALFHKLDRIEEKLDQKADKAPSR
jgi:hypothetical protein